jgi:hypothetical protein
MPYVTGAAILTHVGNAAPTAADTAWATACAAAIEAVIAHRMADVTVAAAGPIEAELIRAGTQDGAAAYVAREAPHGIRSLAPDQDVVRMGADIVRELEPVFQRYALPGIG